MDLFVFSLCECSDSSWTQFVFNLECYVKLFGLSNNNNQSDWIICHFYVYQFSTHSYIQKINQKKQKQKNLN